MVYGVCCYIIHPGTEPGWMKWLYSPPFLHTASDQKLEAVNGLGTKLGSKHMASSVITLHKPDKGKMKHSHAYDVMNEWTDEWTGNEEGTDMQCEHIIIPYCNGVLIARITSGSPTSLRKLWYSKLPFYLALLLLCWWIFCPLCLFMFTLHHLLALLLLCNSINSCLACLKLRCKITIYIVKWNCQARRFASN